LVNGGLGRKMSGLRRLSWFFEKVIKLVGGG
jgi:hypothetical protein